MSEAVPIATEKPSAPTSTVGRWHYLLLALIILLGIALRFMYLDRPVLWGDEAATWARTCGTFQEMLEGNRHDGFVPLHYELYWLMGQTWKLTPFLMRLVPAICGALMVPAMYFLARQLLRPNAALLVALFTATSAFFLNYSRDAKMYMQTWLALVLHMGFLICWLRKGGAIAWWAWVASGVAAVGLHASAWLVIPIGVLILATSGRPRWRWILYPVGIVIMAVGPYVYYTHYNTWKERSGGLAPTVTVDRNIFRMPREQGQQVQGNWVFSGIAWIERHTHGKTGPELVRNSLTAYLFGYSRAEEEVRDGGIPIPPGVLNAAWGTLAAIVTILLAGAVRWPTRRDVHSTAGPWSSWKVLLWLGTWTILPAYGFFYCRSVQDPASPVDWLTGAFSFLSWHLLWIIAAGATLAYLAGRFRIANLILAWILALLVVGLVATAVIRQHGAWYLSLMDLATAPAIAGTLLAISLAVSWGASADDNRSRIRRMLAAIAVVAAILVMCEAAYLFWDHLRQQAHSWRSIWMPRYLAVIAPAVIIVLAIAVIRLPGRVIPALAASTFIAVNLVQFGARLYFDPEPRVDLIARDLVDADSDPAIGVFVKDGYAMGSPGAAGVNDTPTRYYIHQIVGGKLNPLQARSGPTDTLLSKPFGRFHSTRWLLNELKRRPNLQTLILWERMSLSRDKDVAELARTLGPDWQLHSQWMQQARRHWNWQEIDAFRRLEFHRVPQPAATPSTRPTTRNADPLFGDP